MSERSLPLYSDGHERCLHSRFHRLPACIFVSKVHFTWAAAGPGVLRVNFAQRPWEPETPTRKPNDRQTDVARECLGLRRPGERFRGAGERAASRRPSAEGRLQRFCRRIVCIRTNPGNALHAQHRGRRVREPVVSEQRSPQSSEPCCCEYFCLGARSPRVVQRED